MQQYQDALTSGPCSLCQLCCICKVAERGSAYELRSSNALLQPHGGKMRLRAKHTGSFSHRHEGEHAAGQRAWCARRRQRKPHIRPQPDAALGHRKDGAICDHAHLRQPLVIRGCARLFQVEHELLPSCLGAAKLRMQVV